MTVVPSSPSFARVAVAGALGGLLSGLFGVGGGVVMVPIFVLWLGMDQRRAVTTSLIAIIPIATLGTLGYALGGAVDWSAGLALAIGSVLGAQVGAALLHRIPVAYLQAAFSLLLFYSAYRLVLPAEYTTAIGPDPSWWVLGIAGVIAGLTAGLLGVGGGIIIVPALVLLAGTNLDVARGTSLMVVIATAVTASFTNIRAGRPDTRTGVISGLVGAPVALLAAFLGQWLPERQVSILFAVLVVYAAVQMLRKAYQHWDHQRSKEPEPEPEPGPIP